MAHWAPDKPSEPSQDGFAQPTFRPPYATLPVADLASRLLLTRPVRTWPLPEPTCDTIVSADAIVSGRFTYVGESYALAPGFSWKQNPSLDKEWQIAHHKHYFAIDLCLAWRTTADPVYLARWVELTRSWLAEMGTGFIAASDAQVEAKRIESWIMALLLLGEAPVPPQIPPDVVVALVERLGEEAVYVSRNLKPSRNHRTFQLYAMFLVGLLFPELAASRELLEAARSKLVGNLLADFTPDGVHAERSTHYHNITLETALGFVELSRLNGLEVPAALMARLACALDFSVRMRLPDGEIPLIGDSDTLDHRTLCEAGHRIYGTPELAWAATCGAAGTPPSDVSKEFGGYFILTDHAGDGARNFGTRQHVFYDCAPLGEGSHSHYDLFSVCWSAGGRQVVVDPGRYTYRAEADTDGIDWRHAFKSTRVSIGTQL